MSVSPKASCRGLAATMSTIVVQFGFATMPRGRREIAASGFTSETTRGTSSSAAERRGVVDHDRAPLGGDRGPLLGARTAGGEQRDVHAVEGLRRDGPHLHLAVPPRQTLAGRALRGEEDRIALERERPDDPADGASPHRPRRWHRRSRPGHPSLVLLDQDRVVAQAEHGVDRLHGGLDIVRDTTTDTRIVEVEIISMLTPAADSAPNIFAAIPGWVFIPAPTSETLAMSSSTLTPAAPTSSARGSSTLRP
jgi:hypothetical protein